MLDSARQAAAYQNRLDNNVQSGFLKQIAIAGLKVHEAADVTEFMKNLEMCKQN